MNTSGNSRIVIRRLVDGSRSFTFSIVRNFRLNGRPTHLILAKIGTFRECEFLERAKEFHKIVERELNELLKANKLWVNDAEKIRKQFSKVIPAPAVTKTVEPESNYETMQSVIAEIGEKARKKLQERGINL